MINVVVIGGNLTRDPEMRFSKGGKAVTNWTVALNEGTGENRTTQYIRCVAFERLAETVAERARKGSFVVVDGRLAPDEWTDKEGHKQERTRIIARSCQVMDRREKRAEEADLGDLPF